MLTEPHDVGLRLHV